MKRVLLLALLIQSGLSVAWAYDQGLAQGYQQFYAPFAGADTLKMLRIMPAEELIKAVRAKEPLTVLDVRTPEETKIVGLQLPDTLVVPMDQVFASENLNRIPTDRKLVVMCKTGYRAMAIAMSLRQTGFNNVHVLNGGMDALENYLSPKTLY